MVVHEVSPHVLSISKDKVCQANLKLISSTKRKKQKNKNTSHTGHTQVHKSAF